MLPVPGRFKFVGKQAVQIGPDLYGFKFFHVAFQSSLRQAQGATFWLTVAFNSVQHWYNQPGCRHKVLQSGLKLPEQIQACRPEAIEYGVP